jgi:hypothetical protein
LIILPTAAARLEELTTAAGIFDLMGRRSGVERAATEQVSRAYF